MKKSLRKRLTLKLLLERLPPSKKIELSNMQRTPKLLKSSAKDASIRKFLVQKVRDKLLESFESQLKWIEDADIVAMMKKWKRVTSNDELEASTAMKRIIKDNALINEAVEQHLEEMMESEDDEEN